MGCVAVKRSKKQLNQESDPSLNITIFQKAQQTLEQSLKDNTKLNFTCRKFKISAQELKILRIDISKLYILGMKGSAESGERMKKVLKDFLLLASTKNYFFTNLHYACIPDFNIETGLSIFIIFLLTQKIEFTVCQTFPFIEVFNHNEVFKEFVRSWTDFVELLVKMNDEYRKVKYFKDSCLITERLMARYAEIDDDKARKRVKYFKQLIEIYKGFVIEIQGFCEKILGFAVNFDENKKIFEKISKSLKDFEINKCERLVHLVF